VIISPFGNPDIQDFNQFLIINQIIPPTNQYKMILNLMIYNIIDSFESSTYKTIFFVFLIF